MNLPESVCEIELKCDVCNRKFKIYRYKSSRNIAPSSNYPYESDGGIIRSARNDFDNNAICNECWDLILKNVIKEIKRKKEISSIVEI